jgi:hypothetical protein
MPTFLSTKRSRVLTVAAAGALTLAAAVSTAAAAAPAHSSVASASAADAYLDVLSAGQAATWPGSSVGPVSMLEHAALTEKARSIQSARERQAAAAVAARTAAQQADQGAMTAPSGSPRQVAETMLSQFGWPAGQFACLQPLWAQESGWSVTAENPGSGAYGIPQALPGSKMASAGPDWATDAATQIRWGLTYIQRLYGSPCGAWAHEEADGWY